MELMEAIRKRVSVRNFSDIPIPDEVITEMLEAARLSPSGGNRQGWIFGVVKDAGLNAARTGGGRSDVDHISAGGIRLLRRYIVGHKESARE